MATSVIFGSFFIIPNVHRIITADDEASMYVMEYHNNIVKELGLSEDFLLKIGDRPIEIWTHNKANDEDMMSENWWAHGLPYNIHKKYRFVSMLPERMIREFTEGDVLTFDMLGFHIVLEAQQIGYRYQSFGTFEETLKLVS